MMRDQIQRAMQDHDRLVLVFDYTDKKGQVTRRVASPIRFAQSRNVLALCLSREEPRMFQMDRISNLRLADANQFVMPVPMVTLSSATLTNATLTETTLCGVPVVAGVN